MTTPPMTESNAELTLTPDEVREAELPVVAHNGYDALAVRHWLDRVGNELAIAHYEISRLEVDLAESQNSSGPDISAETVNLLSRAQAIADKHISDAEQYAYDLIEGARKQYTDILQKAESHVAAASAGATPVVAANVEKVLEYSVPIPQIEYIRTYTKVAQVQLRAVIDSLVEQIDQLGEVPGARLSTGSANKTSS